MLRSCNQQVFECCSFWSRLTAQALIRIEFNAFRFNLHILHDFLLYLFFIFLILVKLYSYDLFYADLWQMTLFVSLSIMMNKENVNNDAWVDESFKLAMFWRVASAFDFFVKLSHCLNSYNSEYDYELNAFNNVRSWHRASHMNVNWIRLKAWRVNIEATASNI